MRISTRVWVGCVDGRNVLQTSTWDRLDAWMDVTSTEAGVWTLREKKRKRVIRKNS